MPAPPPRASDLGTLTAAAVKVLRMSHFTIERAPLVVMWLDAGGRIRRVNERGCELLGYTREALLSLRFAELLGADGEGRFRTLWRDSPQSGDHSVELDLIRGDGATMPADLAVSHLELEGQPLNCVFIRDITERRRADQALRQALAEVERFKNQLQQENVYLRDEIRSEHDFDDIVGSSSALARTLAQVQQVAASDASVLVLGESGTGKELIARAIHERSPRATRALVKLNCAALPEHLIESELFGHERGAFTGATQRRVGRFELADGGTIFLDEIGELPLSLQPKLLRVLQEGEFERLGDARTRRVDVRVIAATNRDLQAAVDAGAFRADLYYRLDVFPIAVPPLRDRPEDIPLLAAHFAARFAARQGQAPAQPSARMAAALQAYAWPGNVRELQNVIERAVILRSGPALELAQPLPPAARASAVPAGAGEGGLRVGAPRTLRELEVEAITAALQATDWVVGGKQGAARLLDMPASTLRERIARYGIRRSE